MSDILEDWLAEDIGRGDVTSKAVVRNSQCKADITGGPAVLSGIDICKDIFSTFYITLLDKLGDIIDFLTDVELQ